MKVQILREVVYQSNFDYEASYENLCKKYPSVDIMPNGCIRFPINLKTEKIWVQLTPKRKVQFTYRNEYEKLIVSMILKRDLILLHGEKEIKLDPVEQHIYNIPYPSPSRIEMLWCDEVIIYRKDYIAMFFNKISKILSMAPIYLLLGLILDMLRKQGKF